MGGFARALLKQTQTYLLFVGSRAAQEVVCLAKTIGVLFAQANGPARLLVYQRASGEQHLAKGREQWSAHSLEQLVDHLQTRGPQARKKVLALLVGEETEQLAHRGSKRSGLMRHGRVLSRLVRGGREGSCPIHSRSQVAALLLRNG